MLNKIVYVPENTIFENDFNVITATIIGMNIKSYKQKEIVKPMIPDKTVTYWGAVITLRFETGDVVDVIWKLDKTVISENNDVPCIAVMKKRNKRNKKNKTKRKIKESAIPTILRAAGVNEWAELKGTKVRVKTIGGSVISKTGCCISPINESSGRWFYPHYFEFQNFTDTHSANSLSTTLLDSLKEITPDITCERDITDPDLRNIIIEKIVNENRDLDGDVVSVDGISYYVDAMTGIIRTAEEIVNEEPNPPDPLEEFLKFLLDWMTIGGSYVADWMDVGGSYIAQEEQNQFKERFTELYDNAFGREEENAGHCYGLAKMNKFMEKQKIGYKIKVVYPTDTSPRHWRMVLHDYWPTVSGK